MMQLTKQTGSSPGFSFTPASESSWAGGGLPGVCKGQLPPRALSADARGLSFESRFSETVVCHRGVPLLREKPRLNYSSRFVAHISVLRIMLGI